MVSTTLIERIDRIIQNNLHLPEGRQKHYSFITRRNKIYAWGYNQSFKSHPTAAKFGHRFNSIHSELSAIKSFSYPLSTLREYSLVNVRVNPTGTIRSLAKPCPKCLYFLSCFNLHEVQYTNERGVFVCL